MDSEAEARVERWRKLEAQGINRSEIARREGISRQRVTAKLGPLPDRGGRKEKRIYVHEGDYRKAAEVAKSLGLRLRAGETSGEGSVSLLVELIGRGQLVVSRRTETARPKEETDGAPTAPVDGRGDDATPEGAGNVVPDDAAA
jgi:hypothetical protein